VTGNGPVGPSLGEDARGHDPTGSQPAAKLWPWWLVVVLFCALQVVVVLAALNGPFLDEGVNNVVGVRILRGVHDDIGWMGGSAYLTPVLAGIGYQLGGLIGSRLVCVVIHSVALVVYHSWVERRFSPQSAWWATLMLAFNGIYFAIGHLVVYDALAFLGLCVTLRGIEGLRPQAPGYWIAVTALGAGLAVVSKYAVILLIAGVLIVAGLQHQYDRRKLLSSVATILIVVGAYMWTMHGFIIPQQALDAALDEVAPFGRPALFHQAVFGMGLPLALAVWAVSRGGNRSWYAVYLLGLALVWPVLHVALVRYVSLIKHCIYGCAFLYPLIGVWVAKSWQRSRAVAGSIVGLGAIWGCVQWYVMDHSWSDIRPVAAYLVPQLGSNPSVVADPGWDLAMYAMLDGDVTSMSAISDRSQFQRGADVCQADWVVVQARGGAGMDTPLAQEAFRCGFNIVRSFPGAFLAVLPPSIVKSDGVLQVLHKNPRR